ncbi:hypothetical protein SDC9_135280 [bioreactor metagenome]|uniref:Uncharacterized protein n=1 Tax=bioreactor metagenome TaxID=1076179 RepID=A0A645DFX9_9ZZZZ
MVFHRGAGERDVPVGADGPRGAGLAGVGVLDVLGLVKDYPCPFYLREERIIAIEQ